MTENVLNIINVINVINIQRHWRGLFLRKKLTKLQDNMTPILLLESLNLYNNIIQTEKKINNSLKNKKIRYSNFPSHISENIVKFVFAKKYGVMPTWETKVGDLCLFHNETRFIKIEVKGSIDLSNGPSSFGPTECWDYLYFVDGVDHEKNFFKVYEIKLSNNSKEWKNIKVSKTDTYENQCFQKRRPRVNFKEIYKQLGENCSLIFNDNILNLF